MQTEPEIVFIHGFSQSHLSWIKQVTGELAKDFHMVTYDLRHRQFRQAARARALQGFQSLGQANSRR